MKKLITLSLASVAAMALLAGCDFKMGGGSTTRIEPATVGQQLIDLKRAKDAGAISDAEYEAEKSKFLGQKP
jgi:outer membrane lipopolysaccharide assembly protein LptE/RlpB